MGHARTILTFEPNDSQQKIQQKCDAWGNANADIEERGYTMGGLGSPINFTRQIFENQEQAEKYLDSTFGNYRQIAVRFKRPKGRVNTQTKKIEDLHRRIGEYQQRIAELNKPHFQGVKSATIKCKNCQSSLATAYCGKSYSNNCPVCGVDLRPVTDLEKLQKYTQTYKQLCKQLNEERNKLVSKEMEKGYDLCWAVACEVHN